MTSFRLWHLLLLAGYVLGGCVSTTTTATVEPRPTRETGRAKPIELDLVSANGEPIAVQDLRGRPLLLFLFATFDIGSQATLEPLQEALKAHPEIRALGIAVQPDPEPLLDTYAGGLEVSFPLAYDPQQRVLRGDSPLGEVHGVPTLVMLDAQGRIRGRHVGVPTREQLEELIGHALDEG